MKTLEGKVAIVTGGSRGIGVGIASELARRGAAVAVTYARQRELAEEWGRARREVGEQVLAVQLILEERRSIVEAFARVREAFGPIDILVNNAAKADEKPFDELTDEDWDSMMAVNLRGPFGCAQEVLAEMLDRGWGRIVNITSIGGQWGGRNQVHYAAAKAGLINLTRSLANLYSNRGLTTNAVAIGLVETEMSRPELASDAGRRKVEQIPAGRVGTVEDVAKTVAFLCSDESDYITGQTINLNGGMLYR